MSWRAGKLPELYQEGLYQKRKLGKTVNVGKAIKTSSSIASAASGHTGWRSHPPPVPLQHFGEQDDMDTSLDYLDLDPELPTQEEICCSYGKVQFPNLFPSKWTELFPKTQN